MEWIPIKKLNNKSHQPIRQFFVLSQQWKHSRELGNLFKVNNRGIQRTPLWVFFWCLYCYLWINFSHCSCVFSVYFEYINAGWEKTRDGNSQVYTWYFLLWKLWHRGQTHEEISFKVWQVKIGFLSNFSRTKRCSGPKSLAKLKEKKGIEKTT